MSEEPGIYDVGRGAARAGGALHNMSAPPRITLDIRPLDSDTGADRCPVTGPQPVTRPGIAPLAVVDLDAAIRAGAGRDKLPATHSEWPRTLPNAGQRGQRRKVRSKRLRGLVLLARLASGRTGAVCPVAMTALEARCIDSLQDELLALAARLDPIALGLPACALARAWDGESDAGEFVTDPARAVAIFTHSAGGVFVASRAPVLPDLKAEYPAVCLFGVGGGAG